MKYAWLVALREFADNARTKGFWIGLLIFPLLIWASIKVPMLLARKATPTRYYVLVDRAGDLAPVVEGHLREWEEKRFAKEKQLQELKNALRRPEEREEYQQPKRRFVRVPLPAGSEADSTEVLKTALKPYLTGKEEIQVEGTEAELFALVVLPADLIASRKGAEFWCTNLADTDLQDEFETALTEEVRRREFVAVGTKTEDVLRINALKLDFEAKDPKKEAGKEEVDFSDTVRQWAPVAFVYMLFIAIMTVAQMLLNNSIEEKSNRIAEVLLSSVTPTELMAGKLMGIAAVGFTMMIAWVLSGIGVIKLSVDGETSKVGAVVLEVLLTPKLLVAFGVYFVFGYLMYASMFLAIGSMCNTIKEAQNFMGPVMMIMIVPLLTMSFIPKDPNGMLARVMSWIPIYTPFVMMNRAGGDPPLFDWIGTSILLVLSVFAMLWMAGKIFRIGILRTGQPPKLLELFSWLRRGSA